MSFFAVCSEDRLVAVVSVDGIWMARNTLPTGMECRDPHMQDNFQTRTCTRPRDPRRVKTMPTPSSVGTPAYPP